MALSFTLWSQRLPYLILLKGISPVSINNETITNMMLYPKMLMKIPERIGKTAETMLNAPDMPE